MRSGVRRFSTAVGGAWWPGSLLSWHEAQLVKYWLTPALSDCAKALVANASADANRTALDARCRILLMLFRLFRCVVIVGVGPGELLARFYVEVDIRFRRDDRADRPVAE